MRKWKEIQGGVAVGTATGFFYANNGALYLVTNRHVVIDEAKGLVSSAYGIDFNNSPMFLVDANLHPGMSGSPVLTRAKNVWPDKAGNTNMMTGSPVYFLGVFSATLSVKLAPTQDEAFGLGAVWYSTALQEIIKSIR